MVSNVNKSKALTFENLPLNINSTQLREMLEAIGPVNWVYLKGAPRHDRNNQTGYIEMSREQDAAKVIVKWNGSTMGNQVVRVKYISIGAAVFGEGFKPPELGGTAPKANSNPFATMIERKGEQIAAELNPTLTEAPRVSEENSTTEFNFTTQTHSRRWPVILLVMLILAGLGYASYYLSQYYK